MGATYTRQSTFTDGDIITAAHSNDEFNQLLAAFAASTGHTHDGTTAEGGPITKLLGTAITIGDGSAGNDIAVTFDGETSDGILTWKEDEVYFEFSDDILIATTEKLQFRDTAIYINSSTDGQLDLVADTEIQIAATTIDINGNADISGNLGIGGNLTVTGTTTFNGGTLTLGDADTDNIVFGGEVDSDIVPDDDNTHDLGSSSKEWKDIYIDGVAYLDSINYDGTALSATAAEINIIDGDTSATSTTLADADRVIVNDAGTMKQVALTDFETYFESALDTLSNVTTVGALDSGSITSGFGSIDNGTSNITSGGLLKIDTDADADDLTGDSSSGRLTLGAGEDLNLYHGGTNSYIVNDTGDLILDTADDIVLDADGGDVFLKDDGTTFGSLTNTSGNLIIKSGTTTALTFSGANATIAGDLTISGDDLTMGTNTSGHIMVADGTNFNPVAVSGDVTISNTGAVTIASGAVETAMLNANVISGQSAETSLDTSNDTLLLFDNSASGLKKITLATLSSGLGGITDVVADTSPQLGGSLDVNGEDIVSVSNGNITLTPNGTGVVRVDGTSGIDMQSGGISIKNSGSESYVRFYCESSNAHYSQLQASPHSAYSGNVTLVLPASADTLVGRATTDTLTNKTLTSPKINEDVALTSTATELNLLDGVSGLVQADFTKLAAVDSTSTELNLVDGSSAGTIVNSKAVIYGSSGEVNATTLQIAGTSITSTATELNLLDGVSGLVQADFTKLAAVDATATELNIMDGDTSASSTTLADADRIVTNDNGTMKQVALTDVKTYLTSAGFSSEDPTALAIALG